MDSRHVLLFQKGSGNAVNSFTQWGIVCIKPPFKTGGKTKEPAKTNWFDEDGEDTFIPGQLRFEAYDAEFEMAYKGKELADNPFDLDLAFSAISQFKNWLSGTGSTGAELKIYSPYTTIGRQGCYLLEIDDEDPCVLTREDSGNAYHENVVTFKVKFRVTDPVTNITLS